MREDFVNPLGLREDKINPLGPREDYINPLGLRGFNYSFSSERGYGIL